MEKDKIMNDMEFRRKCCNYGLSWSDFNIFDNIIILKTPRKDTYVLLDDKYNIIDIPQIDLSNPNEKIEDVIIKYNNSHNNVDKNGENIFLSPFQNLSFKQLLELSKRITVRTNNNGHSCYIIVNGEYVEDQKNNIYVDLLLYINFLGKQIKQYYTNLYQMRMMGIDYPDVYSYINSIMDIINKLVEEYLSKNSIPFPSEIINRLGQIKYSLNHCDHELFGILRLHLIMKKVEMKDYFDYYEESEPLRDEDSDLSTLSTKLLKLLDISDDEVRVRLEDVKKTMKFNDINLKSFFSNKSKDNNARLIKK